MELRHLEVVAAIAETGTLSAAAARLHVVQSGVSTTLAQLERELGAPLFQRTPRRAVPTDAGLALLPVAREMLALAGHASGVVGQAGAGLRGSLTIGTMTTQEPVDLPGLLGDFAAAHPDVTVTMRAVPHGTVGLRQSVLDGDVDLCFASLSRSAPPEVESFRLATTPMQLLLPREHPLADRTEVGLADLADERWIDSPLCFGNRAVTDDAFLSARVARQVGLEITDLSTMPRYVGAGLGPTIVPAFVPTLGLPSPRLVGPGSDGLSWPVDLVVMAGPRRRAVAQAFVDAALARITPLG
ncbi:LysR family transcriptional regulator [soil metagenome]